MAENKLSDQVIMLECGLCALERAQEAQLSNYRSLISENHQLQDECERMRRKFTDIVSRDDGESDKILRYPQRDCRFEDSDRKNQETAALAAMLRSCIVELVTSLKEQKVEVENAFSNEIFLSLERRLGDSELERDRLRRCISGMVPCEQYKNLKGEFRIAPRISGSHLKYERASRYMISEIQEELLRVSKDADMLKCANEYTDSDIEEARHQINLLRKSLIGVEIVLSEAGISASYKVKKIMALLENSGEAIKMDARSRLERCTQFQNEILLHYEQELKRLQLMMSTMVSKDHFFQTDLIVQQLSSQILSLKNQIGTVCSLVLSKLDGLNGYLKLMVPRIELDVAHEEILRGNFEIKRLRSKICSVKDLNASLELDLRAQTNQGDQLRSMLSDMVPKKDLILLQEHAENAQQEIQRLRQVLITAIPRSRMESIKRQSLALRDEVQQLGLAMSQVVPDREAWLLQQQKLKSMVPREESQTHIQQLRGEISWSRTLISELLSKSKLKGNASGATKNDVPRLRLRFSGSDTGTAEKTKFATGITFETLAEARCIVDNLAGEVVWMVERLHNAQKRVLQKFECLDKFIGIMIPKQYLDVANENLRYSAQQIERLQQRMDTLVSPSELWASQAEIQRLSSVLQMEKETTAKRQTALTLSLHVSPR